MRKKIILQLQHREIFSECIPHFFIKSLEKELQKKMMRLWYDIRKF